MSRTRLFQFILLLIIFIGFQNCGQLSDQENDSGVQQTTRFLSTNGNGNSYDGKLTLQAPEIITPGQTAVIRVLGGEPPYRVSSSNPNVSISPINTSKFLLKLSDNDNSPSIKVEAIDQRDQKETATIKVWGVNRWFFRNPKGLAHDSKGNVYVVEQNRPSVTVLDSTGSLLYRIDRVKFPDIKFGELDRVTVSPRNILYVSNTAGVIHSFDLNLSIHRFSLEVINQLPWNNCGGVTDLEVHTDQSLFVSCDNQIFKISSDGKNIKPLFTDITNGTPIGAFVISSENQLVLARNQGIFQRVQFDGRLLQQSQMTHSRGIHFHQVSQDMIKLNNDEFIVTGRRAHGKNIFKYNIVTGKVLQLATENENYVMKMQNSYGLAMLPGGRFAVSEYENGAVYIYDLGTFEIFEKWGRSRSTLGSFNSPRDVKVFEGKIYILDTGNNRIVVYNEAGDYLKEFKSPKDKPFSFRKSESFTVNKDGSIFTVNANSGQVIVTRTDGSLEFIGSTEEAINPHYIRRSYGITLSNDKMYIVSEESKTIRVWTKQGDFISEHVPPEGCRYPRDIEYSAGYFYLLCHPGKWSAIYILDEQLNTVKKFEKLPDSIIPVSGASSFSVHAEMNKILVADTGNNRIVIYDLNGRFLGKFGSLGDSLANFYLPSSVTMDSKGRIIVTDSGNSRIQIFPAKFKGQ